MCKMTKKTMLLMGVGGNAVTQVLNIQKMNQAYEIVLLDSNPMVVEEWKKIVPIWMYPYMNEESLRADRWFLDNYELVYGEHLANAKEIKIKALFEKQRSLIANTELIDDIVLRIKEMIISYQSIDVLISFDNEEEKVFVKHLSEGLDDTKQKVRWWVVFPFDFEGDRRKNLTLAGYELLIDTYPNVSMIHRDRMKELGSHLKEQLDSFDLMVYKAIKGQTLW